MERDKKKNDSRSNILGKQLFRFIDEKRLEKAKLLAADPHCNVNWLNVTFDMTTPLMQVSLKGYYDVIEVLLKRQDLLVNYQNGYNYPALIHISEAGKIRCAELLLNDSRIDVNLVNHTAPEHSALWAAYTHGRLSMMKLLISHGASVEGIAESVPEYEYWNGHTFSPEATEVIENWTLYLPEFTKVAKTNKYYPSEFKEWAFNFILCCLRSKAFPKDIIYLLLEYIARAWKNKQIKNVDEI